MSAFDDEVMKRLGGVNPFRKKVAVAEQSRLCECECGKPTTLAKKTDVKTGAIAGQPNRFLRGHSSRNRHRATCVHGHPLDESNMVLSESGERLGCKRCRLGRTQEWRANTRLVRLANKYGLTVEQVEDVLDEADGKCMICGTEVGRDSLHFDHNHNTGKFRGLLCGPCNRGIGLLKDSRKIVLSALHYLEERDDG